MTEDNEEGPGAAYKPFQTMEDLLDKLKLLDYERDFVAEMKMRPLNRHYFVVQTNPGEQFFVFTSLAAWMIRKSGKRFEAPQEFDDPNGTIANILDHVRRLGSPIDFAPSKLKQGYGEQALFVLDILCNEALKSIKFEWKHPIIPSEDGAEDDEVDDEDAEVDIDRMEEDMAAEYSDEEEEDVMHIDDIMGSMNVKKENNNNDDSNINYEKPEGVLKSNVDTELWRLEVERVTPALKVTRCCM